MSKELTQTDIESLGWVLHENSRIYCRDKYKLMYSPLNEEFNMRVWTNLANEGYSDTIFEGTIKTKSELTILLKQLNIK